MLLFFLEKVGKRLNVGWLVECFVDSVHVIVGIDIIIN